MQSTCYWTDSWFVSTQRVPGCISMVSICNSWSTKHDARLLYSRIKLLVLSHDGRMFFFLGDFEFLSAALSPVSWARYNKLYALNAICTSDNTNRRSIVCFRLRSHSYSIRSTFYGGSWLLNSFICYGKLHITLKSGPLWQILDHHHVWR